MDKKEIERLRKICDAATRGPWLYDHGNWVIESRSDVYLRQLICSMSPEDRTQDKETNKTSYDPSDGVFIVEARIALPEALNEIEALNMKLEIAREALAYCASPSTHKHKRLGDWVIPFPGDIAQNALDKINGAEK